MTEEDHVSNLSAFLKPVWESLRKELAKYSDTCFCATQSYISWRLKDSGGERRTVICYVNFQKKNLRLDILRGARKGAGKTSEGFFTFDESKEVAEEKISKHGSGETYHEYRIKLKKLADLDDVMFLLEQKYKSMA